MKKNSTNLPYKVILPVKTKCVEVQVLDRKKDVVFSAPFDEGDSIAKNLIIALQFCIEAGAKLKELQFVIED